ncbi:hypothetical protein ACWOMK_01635 [Bacillus thuringiensis]|uniref:hypothetical protein n=1 Tax=Bacillus cereus group sp. BY10-2LC TaxID=3018089 RepID=UPI00065BC003|nr:hypothetical protein [Bacillus cereus group sp. BY10-2LC]KMQ01834.1 hypothetical protein TU68_21810 [Bacillus cereus]MBR9745101.1 hypothetical protein [Bacillus cereus]MDA1879412.1 hypothetical protein [Bacillus cereus group sp. BY10-2LC]
MKKCDIRLFFIFTLILLGGCTINQKNEEQQIVEKANETAVKYFKEKENIDVIVTKVDIRPAVSGGMIRVSGHVKDQKNRKFFVSISKRQNYSVVGWGLDHLES